MEKPKQLGQWQMQNGKPKIKKKQLPQQEISDEEIEKAAKECRFNDLDISVGSFELGARWYREQLKQRQNGNNY